MKSFLKLSTITLLFSLSVYDSIYSAAMPMPQGIGMQSHPSAAQVPSVHEMFKDIPEQELLMMMEEGQQFIKYLEEHGTPEEKMAFAQAMEETLQSFTPDDWAEFEAIVETVQDKLPPLVIEEPKEEIKVVAKKEEIKKETPKIVIDNSLEKVIVDINKAINALLIKAKSDKVLSEQISINWNKKDEFNEMVRLIQILKSKEHLERLASDKEEIKILVELLRNFNKRLQVENNNFIIADTFGLEIDEETSAENLKKLNSIIKFFDGAIESLLPKIVKFLQEFEPDALKIAEEHDQDAKKALDHATKIEKQKRPAGGYSQRSEQAQRHKNQVSYAPGGYNASGSGYATEQIPGYLENIHHNNLKNIPHNKKPGSKDGQAGAVEKSGQEKKDTKKSAYANAIDKLEDYLETNGNTEVGNYMTTVGKAGNIYAPFGSPISQDDHTRAEQLTENKSRAIDLSPENERFLEKHQERITIASKNFAKNTQAAHSYYADLKDSIDTIALQIDEMQAVVTAIRSSLESMNSADLEKLQQAPSLKSLGQRITNYHDQLKKIQHELRNKHRLHKLERENPYETSAYNDLAKAESLHGLDNKINNVKSQFESLNKSIKSAITRHRREENKKSAQR